MKLPLVIGHRGVVNIAPENSLSGFSQAINLGLDGVELDIHLTRDNKLVVLHDTKLKLFSGKANFIKDFSYQELKRYDLSEKFRKTRKITYQKYPYEMIFSIELSVLKSDCFYLNIYEKISQKRIIYFLHKKGQYFDRVRRVIFPKITGDRLASIELRITREEVFHVKNVNNPNISRESIPLFEDVLNMIKEKIFINIEIKEGEIHYPGIICALMNELKHYSRDMILISSFDKKTVISVKEKYPDVKVSLLINQLLFYERNMSRLDGVNPYYALVSYRKISRICASKKTVFVWTVNNEEDMIQYLLSGVDGIITDYPQVLKKLKHAFQKVLNTIFI